MDELTKDDIFSGGYPHQLDKLIENLDENFPPYYPLPTHSISDIMFRSGQRSVVEYIKDKLNY